MRSRRQIKKRGSKNARNARQRKLEILNAMLEKKVLERTDELRRANEKLVQLARHDALTGLANRLYANERLREEFLRMKRTGCCYSVLMIDVDHFKRINDSYGHKFGDMVLCHVAEAIRKSTRKSDLKCRLGGEEFLIVCLGLETAEVMRLAERIRAAIAQIEIPGISMHGPVRCTATLGFSAPFMDVQSFDHQLALADAALYRGKKSGRNCVQWAGPEDASGDKPVDQAATTLTV